jgi:hypothetical protein
MAALSPSILGKFNDFNLSEEATELLASQTLSEEDADSLHLLLEQQMRQKAFWESDVSASDAEIVESASNIEVSVEEVRKALTDLLDPVCSAKRSFLNDFIASQGDIDKILSAYERKRSWEAENEPLVFTEEDVAPFKLHMIQVFDAVFNQARKDKRAKEMLKTILKDFGTVKGADYRAWLGRRIADAMPTDMMRLAARDAIKAQPGRFNEFVDRFLEDGNAGVAGLISMDNL